MVKGCLSDDGWCIDKGHKLFNEHKIYDNDNRFDFIFNGEWDYCEVYKYRPKSLQGIENNNGWIKINSDEDLPEGYMQCYFITKYSDNTINTGYYSKSDNKFYNNNFFYIDEVTHYQPIIKPKKPLY